MLFQPEHIELIRAGEKTATRRDWSPDYGRPSPGDVRMATTRLFVSEDECECFIRVTDIYTERLGDMDTEDARKEGGYALLDFRDVWRDLHGVWNPDQEVDVVEFEYVGRERP